MSIKDEYEDKRRELEREKEYCTRHFKEMRAHLEEEDWNDRMQYNEIMRLRELCGTGDVKTLSLLESLEENLKALSNCRQEIREELAQGEKKKRLEWSMREEDMQEAYARLDSADDTDT